MPSPTGNTIPLAYGYVWGTGVKVQGITLENTGNSNLDYSRVGGWVLGQDEWDGLEELWDETLVRKLYTNEYQTQPIAITGVSSPTNAAFHFHRGCDATIGGGLAPTSVGPDQGVDSLFQYLPSGVQPLCYHRQSMYWMMLKQWVASPENDHQDNPNNFADINPVGLWRGLRVRLFDAGGTMNGYAFSTNPAPQITDVILRMRLYPEYNLSVTNGPDDLTAAVRRKFDWPSFDDSGAFYDSINDLGSKNYETNWLFNQPTTLQGMLTPMLQACRSYIIERGGVYSLRYDQNRASVFTISRKNLLSISADDKDLHTAPNCEVTNFRDILVPAITGTIVSITYPDHGVITVNMSDPHPFVAGDDVVIGGTNTTYDRDWTVDTVPVGDTVYSFTLVSQGSNFPPAVGAGGYVGLTYARFKERAPEFSHHIAQLGRGAAGIGIARQRNKVREDLNLGNTTFDQASRIGRYERDRRLGQDATPYAPPAALTIELDPYAQDAAGTQNRPIGIDPGDVVIVDDTASVPYAGTYEVLDGLTAEPDTVSNGRVQAGKVTLRLQTFGGYFYDTTDPATGGWPDVPGSGPGNGGAQTDIPLQDGSAAFYSGIAANGSTMPVPSGYSQSTLLAWAGAAGYIEANNQLHVFRNCDVDPTSLILSCVYSDGNKGDSNTWTGDNSYAGLVSRTSRSRTTITIGPMTYQELTLANGEKVIFGSGLVSGTGSLSFSPSSYSPPLQAPYSVALPDGYTLAWSVCIATCKDGIERGDNDAHGFSAWVDSGSGLVHSLYRDGEGNQWCAQYVRLFVFAWKNNMGSIRLDDKGWYKSQLTPKKTLCWIGFESYDAGLNGSTPPTHPGTLNLKPLLDGNLPLPDGFNSNTLQTFTGPASFQIVDHPTHGIRDCFVDYNLHSMSSFEDGEGNIWFGTAGGFALLCDNGPATGNLLPGGGYGPGSGSNFAIPNAMASDAVQGQETTVQANVYPDVISSGVAVTVDASSIGGSSSVPLTQGTPGPLYTPFSGNVTVPISTAVGMHTLLATASDLQGHTANIDVPLNVQPRIPTFAISGATASSATPGANTTVEVDVHPDILSTGITVTVDASSIGGSSSVALSQGTAGPDITPFTTNITVPSGAAAGSYNLVGTASDLEGNTATVNISLTVQPGVTPPSSTFAIPGAVASSVNPGADTTVQVNVHPDPTSTGITVTVDASAIGGSSAVVLTVGLAEPLYTPFTVNIPVSLDTAFGTYNLVATATDLEGHTATANIPLIVQPGDTNAQIELRLTQAGTRFTSNGFTIINRGWGYTASSTAVIEGNDSVDPYGPKSVPCTLHLDVNGGIVSVLGGIGVQWYGPPEFELTR